MKVTKYEDLKIGDSAEVVHTITEDDIEIFGELSGDYNPVHFNEEWAKTTLFKSRIAHGILTASYISTAIGMHLPGPGTIYLGQEMKFLRPVRIGDTITARVEVVEKDDKKERVTLKTTCINQHEKVVLDGSAIVTLMKM
ncbi:MAG: (R)-specific enoyl-CoA hydratase [Candidatus Thorarchaeota archaeon]|nr:MAG: (R)-specific enoyl-CoA hydratase [Candidatus Thorarchaeota archaeon]